MPVLGFLHTAELHVAPFRSLVGEIAPQLADAHMVDAGLLAEAQAGGCSDDRLRGRVRDRLQELEAMQVDLTLCTCSTLGGLVESLGAELRTPVLRVDRPMAEAAVRRGRHIAVVATLPSTLAPTRALLQEVAAAADREVVVIDILCFDAWARFEAGDVSGYLELIERRIRELAKTLLIDVVVLAQASMAPAADLVKDITLPVLSSPRLAIEHAAALIDA